MYERIIKINYNVESDFDIFFGTLYLTFHIKRIEDKKDFKLVVRYTNTEDLTIRNGMSFPLSRDLIIEDLKAAKVTSNQLYRVHDDSGYGTNDGFDFIQFCCKSIEVVEVTNFYE